LTSRKWAVAPPGAKAAEEKEKADKEAAKALKHKQQNKVLSASGLTAPFRFW